MKKIAIITARGGSKGVPRKNLRAIGGDSLIKRSVTAARNSHIFDTIVVSTDDAEIAREAEQCRATVVIRPPVLASDSAKSIDVVVHVLEKFKIADGLCCLLQPTSPLRTEQDIIQAYDHLNTGNFDSIISVCECEHHPYKTLIMKDGQYHPILQQEYFEQPRQSLEKAFRINGAVYLNKIASLLREQTFFAGNFGFSAMPWNRSIDIDSEIDIAIAELLLKGA